MMAHYPEAKAWRVASGFPLEKEDGSPLDEQDRKKILHSVSSYASKVANMVSLATIFKEVSSHPLPSSPMMTAKRWTNLHEPNFLLEPAILKM